MKLAKLVDIALLCLVLLQFTPKMETKSELSLTVMYVLDTINYA